VGNKLDEITAAFENRHTFEIGTTFSITGFLSPAFQFENPNKKF